MVDITFLEAAFCYGSFDEVILIQASSVTLSPVSASTLVPEPASAAWYGFSVAAVEDPGMPPTLSWLSRGNGFRCSVALFLSK